MTNDDEQDAQSDENVEATCRSLAEKLRFDLDAPATIYDPRIVKRPGGKIEIYGKEQNPNVIAWGFWGGILAAVVAVMIVFNNSGGYFTLAEVLVVGSLLLVGLVVFRLGRRSSLDEILLLEIDTRAKLFAWPVYRSGAPLAVTFDDVEEVTFSLIKVAVQGSKAGTRLEAATVRVVDDRGRVLPVVEATTSKTEAHYVARLLAEVLGTSVDYVGTGVREWV